METFTNWIAANGATLIGVAAMLCGVALFSLVMARTLKHRRESAQLQGQ